ncbi:MAG: hypothetical protein NTV86_08780 [Planctomycetota bacterium]|nr:hypothetical protein [Planctomycetota bacterium]
MTRKLILYPAVGLLVLGLGLAGAWYWIGMAGTSALERWIGSQVKSIAGSYLNPRVEFDDLDYQRPYTVVLAKFRLTVDDPDNPGRPFDLIYVDSLRLELAEIPSQGKPIRIKALILDHPKISAVAARSDGKFMGFENMLKKTADSSAESARGKVQRLSEVFQIVLLQIIDGRMVYQSRRSGRPPMTLDAINSRLDVQKDAQGWYKLAATLDRKPVFGLKATGRLDLDHLVLAMDSLNLDVELGPKEYGSLPGDVHQWLKEHEVTGTLKVSASGRLPLGDTGSGDLAAAVSMDNLHFVAGEYKGEAANVSGKLVLKDRRLVLDHLDGDTLKGRVHLAADLALTAPFDGRVQLTAKDILLEETLRAAGGAAGEPKYKGAVNADITLTGPMNQILARSGGGGWLKLRNGRLACLRIVADIGQALAQQIKSLLSGPPIARPDTDSADLAFQFAGDKVHFTKIFTQTSTFAVTGHGDLWFNKRLDLLLNGGSPEKLRTAVAGGGVGDQVITAVGNALNTVGRGATNVGNEILNQVATVVVAGTTDEPKVRVEPFRKIGDLLEGK